MKLPNADRAVVDLRKLRDYCLNPASPKGRSKARVFLAALGLTRREAGFLRHALLAAARKQPCVSGEADEYGRRYTLDFTLRTAVGQKGVRSGWLVRRDEDLPRLTTCFVLKSKRAEHESQND